MGQPTRPALRWHGGKWILAPWIIDYLPEHRMYVEPYGGAASVLLRKERSHGEIYNDLDGDVCNYFRVLRDPILGPQLISSIELTPFSRKEFEQAYLETEDPLERARRLAILSFMGFGSNAHCRRATGFRANSNRSGTTPAHDWQNFPDALRIIAERLRGVVIEQKNALDVMRQHDSPTTLFYVDPPYVWDTRSANKSRYNHDLNNSDHLRLLRFLKQLRGCVVLSGYACDLYDHALKDWERITTAAYADGASERTEVLWLNPQTTKRLAKTRTGAHQLKMFDDPVSLAKPPLTENTLL